MAQNSEDNKKEPGRRTGSEVPIIILAGATGALGGRIARALLNRKARVRAIVRPGSNKDKVTALKKQGAEIIQVDFNSIEALTKACEGGTCVVSALSGLEEVIVDTQTRLLEAAVKAGVPRFIPSDFAIDFTKLPYGANRNLDLRKQFKERLDKAPIAATSILNGMFTDLLNGQAPLVLSPVKRILYWGNPDQPMDFTTMDDTAEFTALAALDNQTPRYLYIAGDVLSPRGLKNAATQARGKKYGLLRAGGLGVLAFMIKVTRTLSPGKEEVFPAWQGMQYLHNMLSGLPKLKPLHNNRYPDMHWTEVQEVLAAH
jgi:nucleoside-diphosphate-sugar epimerase